jgi:hypothetical protein
MSTVLRSAVLFVLAAGIASEGATLLAQAAPPAPIAIRASCGPWTIDSPLPKQAGDPTWPTFRVRFESVGNAPSALILGSVIANDRYYWLQHLSLRVRRQGQAEKVMQYLPAGMPAGIAGRVDPWIVALPPGMTYEMALAPRFAESIGQPFETFDQPAEVRFEFTPLPASNWNRPELEPPFIHLWTHTLASDWIAVPGACPR